MYQVDSEDEERPFVVVEIDEPGQRFRTEEAKSDDGGATFEWNQDHLLYETMKISQCLGLLFPLSLCSQRAEQSQLRGSLRGLGRRQEGRLLRLFSRSRDRRR